MEQQSGPLPKELLFSAELSVAGPSVGEGRRQAAAALGARLGAEVRWERLAVEGTEGRTLADEEPLPAQARLVARPSLAGLLQTMACSYGEFFEVQLEQSTFYPSDETQEAWKGLLRPWEELQGNVCLAVDPTWSELLLDFQTAYSAVPADGQLTSGKIPVLALPACVDQFDPKIAVTFKRTKPGGLQAQAKKCTDKRYVEYVPRHSSQDAHNVVKLTPKHPVTLMSFDRLVFHHGDLSLSLQYRNLKAEADEAQNLQSTYWLMRRVDEEGVRRCAHLGAMAQEDSFIVQQLQDMWNNVHGGPFSHVSKDALLPLLDFLVSSSALLEANDPSFWFGLLCIATARTYNGQRGKTVHRHTPLGYAASFGVQWLISDALNSSPELRRQVFLCYERLTTNAGLLKQYSVIEGCIGDEDFRLAPGEELLLYRQPSDPGDIPPTGVLSFDMSEMSRPSTENPYHAKLVHRGHALVVIPSARTFERGQMGVNVSRHTDRMDLAGPAERETLGARILHTGDILLIGQGARAERLEVSIREDRFRPGPPTHTMSALAEAVAHFGETVQSGKTNLGTSAHARKACVLAEKAYPEFIRCGMTHLAVALFQNPKSSQMLDWYQCSDKRNRMPLAEWNPQKKTHTPDALRQVLWAQRNTVKHVGNNDGWIVLFRAGLCWASTGLAAFLLREQFAALR